MADVVRVARSEGYEVAPRGVRQFYPQGDYKVPDEMPADIARRCLESGIGTAIRTKATKPETKTRKKKPSKVKPGKAAL